MNQDQQIESIAIDFQTLAARAAANGTPDDVLICTLLGVVTAVIGGVYGVDEGLDLLARGADMLVLAAVKSPDPEQSALDIATLLARAQPVEA